MLTRDFKFRVWYKDTDQMGIVHHSNYICYYEAARSELLRSFGSSYADMEEKDGVMMPILEVHSKYLRPAHYDELITVRISLRELPKARITFEYEIYNEAGELLNTGSTVLGFIHRDTRRPMAVAFSACWSMFCCRGWMTLLRRKKSTKTRNTGRSWKPKKMAKKSLKMISIRRICRSNWRSWVVRT